MQTIWISPTEFVSGDPTVQISYPSADHPDTVVTSMEPGDFKWVSMGLPLPPAVALEEINVCYRVSDEQSFISQVRLLTMATPDQSVVLHDDGLDLRSTEPVCYASKVGGKLPSPGTSVRLALRLSFQNTTHEIRLGAVGVKFRPTGALCLNVRDAGAIGDGLSHPLS
jgi:hypothetical protein